jgi:uncharacterized protein (TIGR02996 family)
VVALSDGVEEALLAAVFAAPADDAPRLVYADWLSERADPRGEFITLQCRLETLDGLDPQRSEIQVRADEILQRYNGKWLQHVGRYITNAEWRRGFVWRIHAIAPQFVAGSRQILAAAPAPEVTLIAVRKHVDAVASAPTGQCAKLDIRRQHLSAEHVARIVGSPTIRGLRGLGLFGQPLGPSGIDVLATTPHLTSLDELELGNTVLLDEGVSRLVLSDKLRTLSVLGLAQNRITWKGAEMIARASWPALMQLDLSHNPIGDAGIAAIAASDGFPVLEELWLRRCDLTHVGFESLMATKLPLRRVGLAVGDVPLSIMSRVQARFEGA